MKPFKVTKIVVYPNPAQIQNRKIVRQEITSPKRIVVSPMRYNPPKSNIKIYNAINPNNFTPQRKINRCFQVRNVSAQPSSASVRPLQVNNKFNRINAKIVPRKTNLNNSNVKMSPQRGNLNKANVSVFTPQNNFNNNYVMQQNNLNNPNNNYNLQQNNFNNFNNNSTSQQNNFTNFNNNINPQQNNFNNFNNNFTPQQNDFNNNFNNNINQQQNNFNNNFNNMNAQQNNFNNNFNNNMNAQLINQNNINNNINLYQNQNNFNNNYTPPVNPTNINSNFYPQQQEMTLSIYSPPTENNFRLIERGQGIGDLEYTSIIAAAKEALNCRDDPLSNGVTRRIKSLIGGEWFVYVCMEGLKGYDFNLSATMGSEFVSFVLNKFHFQVCRLHN